MDKLMPLKSLVAALGIIFCGVIYADVAVTPATAQTGNSMIPSDEALQASLIRVLGPLSKNLNVTVVKGIAVLSGQLGSATEYEKAITLALSIPGINDVTADNLTVRNGQIPSRDRYITAKVKGAILESDIMGQDISSWPITIETRDGKVYLSGKISSIQLGKGVVSVVNTVEGVTQVENQMSTPPSSR